MFVSCQLCPVSRLLLAILARGAMVLDQVMLNKIPEVGLHWAYWTGSCSDSGQRCNIAGPYSSTASQEDTAPVPSQPAALCAPKDNHFRSSGASIRAMGHHEHAEGLSVLKSVNARSVASCVCSTTDREYDHKQRRQLYSVLDP
ncbi:hypothetical protein M378DRAFT_400589 [Amanita muscaria Koide BX008]|uniref:Secreted protein n=1 Tax=Amanita muscaria (strain Koide BX008) TaxID=946122 RepID=A0A0C2W7P4_AMAMK|nr:hypothetical protein M378DRAFT_400589 [Amanita muscaria Koide BX008]